MAGLGMDQAAVAVDEDDEWADRRSTPRRRMLKAGVMKALPDYEGTCVVRDLSEGGAKLKVQDVTVVPDLFQLTIELDGIVAKCEVMWRNPNANEMGVKFDGPAKIVEATRKQVIYPPMARPNMPERKARPFERPNKIIFDK